MSVWSEEKTYDERIYPLMSQIIAICREREIPLACTFQYGFSEEDGAELCTTVLTAFERTDEFMRGLGKMHAPRSNTVALAETVVTNPDGSKHITISRV